MLAVVYVRVSSDAQERDGTSLDSQERECLASNDIPPGADVRVIRDVGSGASLDRQGLAEARALIRAGLCEVLVAHSLDRLSRNQNHMGVLLDEAERYGSRLYFVTERFEDTAIGRFILAAKAFVAEVEREKISERTVRGKLERARQGKLPQAAGVGHYGYRYDPVLGVRVVVAEQARVVRHTFERFLQLRSFSAVAGELNEQGVPSFSGARWHPLTIRRMLGAETYVGRTFFRKTERLRPRLGRRTGTVVQRPAEQWIEIPGVTPRIVPDDLWDAVQAALRQPVPPRVRSAYLLSKRIDCLICGAAMVGHTLSSQAYRVRYYRCRHSFDKNSGGSCAARYIRADALEQVVLSHVAAELGLPSLRGSMSELQGQLAVAQVHVQAQTERATIDGVAPASGRRFGRSRFGTMERPWTVEVDLPLTRGGRA